VLVGVRRNMCHLNSVRLNGSHVQPSTGVFLQMSHMNSMECCLVEWHLLNEDRTDGSHLLLSRNTVETVKSYSDDARVTLAVHVGF
jgi:hypothetical protein